MQYNISQISGRTSRSSNIWISRGGRVCSPMYMSHQWVWNSRVSSTSGSVGGAVNVLQKAKHMDQYAKRYIERRLDQ